MDLLLKKLIIFRKNKQLSIDLQLRFLHRLARLLKNGYPLLEALEIIKWDDKLSPISVKIIELLKNGYPIDQALEKVNFHSDISAYLYFVKNSGDLEENILKCVLIFEDKLNYIKKFKQTIRYPLILFIIFFILLTFLQQTVLPSFIDMFQLSDDSTSTISLSLTLVNLVINTVLFITILSSLIAGFWYLIKDRLTIQEKLKIYNRIPIYRTILTIQTSFLFSTHLSSLLKTGLPIKNILTILANQEKLPILSYYATRLTDELSQGIYINTLLEKLDFITPQLSVIFQKNVDSKALERDLSIYAEHLTEELNRKLVKLLVTIQPIFFVILACFIVFIYIALMWPMFQLIKTI